MPVDRVGRRPHRQRRERSPHQVAEVRDLPTAQVARSLRLFGWPAQVGATSDGEGLSLGGPHASPDQWLWAVYAGPSLTRRRQALCLVDAAALAAWRERARGRGTFDGYLGVRTLAGYYLVAQDAHGPYLTGYSGLFMLDPRPSQPPKLVYRQLVRGARWLRQTVEGAPPPTNGLGRHASQ
jgi:hypothetical protein